MKYRTQTIRKTGQAVRARWNVNGGQFDEKIRFVSDGAPITTGLKQFLNDEIMHAMDHHPADTAAERKAASKMVFEHFGVRPQQSDDRPMTKDEWARAAGNPQAKSI